jgi:hypothetical protein
MEGCMSESELERSRRVNARPNNTVLVPCDELKKMQDRIEELEYKNSLLVNRLEVIVGSKPLSDEEIREIYQDYWLEEHGQIVDFVRAIEERHGIK